MAEDDTDHADGEENDIYQVPERLEIAETGPEDFDQLLDDKEHLNVDQPRKSLKITKNPTKSPSHPIIQTPRPSPYLMRSSGVIVALAMTPPIGGNSKRTLSIRIGEKRRRITV